MKIKGIILLASIFLSYPVLAQEVKTEGYQGMVEIGGGMSVGDGKGGFYNADIINGYRFNKSVSIGLGVGIRAYSSDNTLIPVVYANFRANMGYDKYENFYPYIQTGLGFPIFKQSIGIAFKNIPVKVGIYGEILPIFGASLYTNFGLNVGVTF